MFDIELQLDEQIQIEDLEIGIEKVYPTLENLIVEPSGEEQNFKSQNYYGYGKVKVGAVKLQDKEITLNKNGVYTVVADNNYTGLSEVEVTLDAIEDLDNELNTYQEELTTQETTVDELTELLKTKGIGEPPKYKPKYISFEYYPEEYFGDELTQLDTSEMTSMRRMFYHPTSSINGKMLPYIKNIDVSGFDTSKVEDMSYMFYYQTTPVNSDFSNFDTSNVTNMSYMFSQCSIKDVSGMKKWNVSKVTDMSYMFERNLALEGDADFSGWDVSNVKTFKGMFQGLTWSTSKKINFIFDGWLLSNATTMESMFDNQGYIEELNINHFKPEKLGSGGLSRTWYYCRNLKKLNISDWICPELTSISSAWSNCIALEELDISGLSCEKLTNVSSAWSSCSKLTTLRFMNNFGRAFTQKSANYSNYTVNLSACSNLTKESLMDVINKLYDLNLTYNVANGGTLYTQKLVIGADNIAKLSSSELEIATNKGWVVS